jgi:NAD(P)-dependent dehydrogenase (short-subunit alcohol dehydrogenase family)
MGNIDMSHKIKPRRTVIVTGAASGAGAATARLFAQQGDFLVLSDLSPMQSIIGEIEAAGGSAVAVEGDLTAAGQPRRIVDAAVKASGGVDVLINNAAYAAGGTLETTSEEDFDRTFAVNVKAGFLLSRAVLAPMRSSGGGSILFTTAVAGHWGMSNTLAYGASKAALIQMVRALALEHAREGIRVNSVSPGPLRTPMLNKAAEIFGAPSVDVFKAIMPTGRITEPEEIAEAFYYLASPSARSITGQTIAIDGGMLAGPFMPR